MAFSLISSLSFSQVSFSGDFLSFGLGAIAETFRDEFYAPFNYEGFSGIAELGYYFQNENWQNTLYLGGGFGVASSPYQGAIENSINQLPAYLHYSLRYKVWQNATKKHLVFAGLLSQNTWNYRTNNRFSNSSQSIAGLFSYGLSASYQLTAIGEKWLYKKQASPWALQVDLNLPVGSYVIRPGYVSQYVGSDFGLSEHLNWSSFFHLNISTALVYQLPNGNQLRLLYRWDYTQVHEANLFQQAQHQLLLSTHFKF
jgi:hypothetical protein